MKARSAGAMVCCCSPWPVDRDHRDRRRTRGRCGRGSDRRFQARAMNPNPEARRRTRAICTGVVAFILGACSPTDPGDAFAIRTDSTGYRLRYDGGMYSVRLRVHVTNPLDRTVFLHRQCGYGESPSRRLLRADGDTTSIRLDSGMCITQPLREPIPLHGGETYVDEVELSSPESPHASPPITLEMRTGEFVLVYAVQLTDAVGGWGPVDPLPPERTTSNPFVVLAPE